MDPTGGPTEQAPKASDELHRSHPHARVWGITAGLGIATLALYALVARTLEPLPAPLTIPWWVLAPIFYLVEAYPVHLPLRRQAYSFSLGELPLTLGLFFTSPSGLILAQVVGAVAAFVTRRQTPIKLSFNLSHFALEVTLATVIFHGITAGDPLGALGWAGTFAATLSTALVAEGAVAGVVALTEGGLKPAALLKGFGTGLIVTSTNTSLALVAATVLWIKPSAIWLLVVPAVTLILAYRAFATESEKQGRLDLLRKSTHVLQQESEIETAMMSFLAHAREIFRADVAEVTLPSAKETQDSLRITVGPGDESAFMLPVDPGHDSLLVDVAANRQPICFARPVKGPHRAYFERRGQKDAIVAPLYLDQNVVGTIMVANRLDDVSTFDEGDVGLFETLANHASTALENGRLEESLANITRLQEELAHQATHDALTGLPNRAHYERSLQETLAGAIDHKAVAVLFVDLDGFKAVNDTLGHDAGDELLKTVATRLQGCLRPEDVVARLGGDEFAVLLRGMTQPDDAGVVAGRIIGDLSAPIDLQGKQAFVGASLGIALSSGEESAGELVRFADAAMYSAKRAGKGRFVLFEPSLLAAAQRRDRMKDDLQTAVEQDQLVLHYQPIVDLSSGVITGVEALIRWNQPGSGLVPPEDFLAIAEETGLILPMGRWVLKEACRQASWWMENLGSTAPSSVHVNLSPRQLYDASLIDAVAEALEQSGLKPQGLVLEINESVLMQDTDAVLSKLHALEELGVRIAIDDFGTGYSSLSYLTRFPIDVLKIDRSFIDGVLEDAQKRALAKAIIGLSDALQLQSVAQGIEHGEQSLLLREMGCKLGQGYHFAKPLEAEAITALVNDRDPTGPGSWAQTGVTRP